MGGWLTGWGYRKSHVVCAAAGAGTNYTVKITVHYGSGVDSDSDVYMGNASPTSEFTISVDSTTHNNYGLSYPATYVFDIPASLTAGRVYYRYSSGDSWILLTEKTSSDFFNGIDCVRFDYTNDKAYVSIAFGSITDTILLKFTNSSDVPISAVYDSIAQYYDNRKCAVVITGDDYFVAACADACQKRHVWYTADFITSGWHIPGPPPDWAAIQTEIDEGYVEIACHSDEHFHLPYPDYDIETGTCKLKMLDNLDLDPLYTKGTLQYLYGWVETYGESDATERTHLGTYKYLSDRSTVIGDNAFATWDAGNYIYNRAGCTLNAESETESSMNNAFDAVYAAGGIYNIWVHPTNVSWADGSMMANHLDHIKDKKDVWYVGFGALYLYHFIQERDLVYISGDKCAGDFRDLRFTSSDGETELDYYLDSKTNQDNAVFWVEVSEDLSSVDRTIFIYYRKDGVASTSNGINTFPLFEDGTFTGWTAEDGYVWFKMYGYGDPVISSPTPPSDYGSSIHKHFPFALSGFELTYDFLPDFAFWGTYRDAGNLQVVQDITNNYYLFNHHVTGPGVYQRIQIGREGGVNELSHTLNPLGWTIKWYDVKIQVTQTTAKVWEDNVLTFNDVWNQTEAFDYLRLTVFRVQSLWGHIILRKFVDPEPPHCAWGPEESSSTTYLVTVASTHGTPTPTVGIHSYAVDSVITCSVPSPVVEGGFTWTCIGWTGTGDIPSSGSASTVTFTLWSQDSSITWIWTQGYASGSPSKGYTAKIYVEGIELGCANDVTIDYDRDLQEYFSIEERTPTALFEGKHKITVKIKKAVINTDLLELIIGTGVLTAFDLQIVAPTSAITITVKPSHGRINVPQDGIISEEHEYIGTAITASTIFPSFCPVGEQVTNGGFETDDFTGWTNSGMEVGHSSPHSGTCDIYGTEGEYIEQTFSSEMPADCPWTVSFWAKGQYNLCAGQGTEVNIQAFNEDGDLLFSDSWQCSSGQSGNWVQYSVSSSETVKRIRITITDDLGGNDVHIDDVSLECDE